MKHNGFNKLYVISTYTKTEEEDCGTQSVQAKQTTREEASRLEYNNKVKCIFPLKL